jgi:CDGSH-type Zn-finger protein
MKITVIENGPNKVELEGATYRVARDGDGVETIERAVFFLCRCGHSSNKPFCDGTHKRVGFEAAGAEIDAV